MIIEDMRTKGTLRLYLVLVKVKHVECIKKQSVN